MANLCRIVSNGANMKRLTSLWIAFILLATAVASSQLTVDATGPARERRRQPKSGSGGSIGRKLPMNVAIEIRDPKQNAAGEVLAVFVLTNSSKEKLTIPVSPNPGDFEPEDPEASYALKCLSLYITSDRAQNRALLPETNLYGSVDSSGTMATLAPGESLRVLARVKLPAESSKPETSAPVFVAHVIFSTETIRTINGRTVVDTEEIGSATSSEYTAQGLLGSSR
jgi:hypothetical protein